MDTEQYERYLMEAKYRLFNYFELEDQRKYYNKMIQKNRRAATQVNFIRGLCAFLTIIVTAAAHIIQTNFVSSATDRCGNVEDLQANCASLQGLVTGLLLLSVVFPALRTFFNMLADLYQWDRLVKVYDKAVKGLELRGALSPNKQMSNSEYLASLLAFTSGTLKVMRDETGQWQQLIRPAQSVEHFQKHAECYY